jgi:mRNA interferase YafQ
MLTVKFTTKFKKDFKKALKRGYDIKLFEYVVTELANQRPLPEKFKVHDLSGDYQGFYECRLQPDWLLIYLVENNILTLTLARTGTHADLF